ncbi:hypothetical protein PUN28_014002 [Cardiocondyla obscurior]|uniref:chymotrypsin n=1 Tax=Cardiocondyla obscurior TaxID=286306 RepID=A0AAW2F760_9HYME
MLKILFSYIKYVICFPNTQIVGGVDALEGKYPYQVSLKYSWNEIHFCGGAIVSQKYVVTAAHCLVGLYNPSDVLIDAGSNGLHSALRTTYKADALIIHPDFNSRLYIHDIGLIKLTKDIAFTSRIKLIEIISYDKNFENHGLTVTGWGTLTWLGVIPERLQKIIVKGFSQKKCAESYNNIYKEHLCTFQGIGQGMCNGDSGGALTYDNKLVGIVSYGRAPCASGYADVFTRVFYYKSWINNYMNTSSN